MCGLETIDVQDLKANTEYVDLTAQHPTVKFFWEIVSSFSNDELKLLLLFVTGRNFLVINVTLNYLRKFIYIGRKFESPNRRI